MCIWLPFDGCPIQGRKGDYLERFMENLEYGTLDRYAEVNAGILDGRYSPWVTMEESAQALLSEGADVGLYLSPGGNHGPSGRQQPL